MLGGREKFLLMQEIPVRYRTEPGKEHKTLACLTACEYFSLPEAASLMITEIRKRPRGPHQARKGIAELLLDGKVNLFPVMNGQKMYFRVFWNDTGGWHIHYGQQDRLLWSWPRIFTKRCIG